MFFFTFELFFNWKREILMRFILPISIVLLCQTALATQPSNIFQSNYSDTTKTTSLQGDTAKVSKITPGVPTTYDWIKLLDGTEMEVEVRKISDKFVFYSSPGQMETDYVDRRKVHTIYYRTGKIEPMSTKPTEKRQVIEWQQVTLTNNPKDVEGMIKVEDLRVSFQATTRHHYYKPETLEISAEIQLRKNAGLNGADFVLVTHREHHRAYGDPPKVTLVGESYRKR